MSCGYCGGSLEEGKTLAELVDRDFSRARWKNLFGRFLARLRGDDNFARLVCFVEGRDRQTVTGRRSLGLQAVELTKIEGSVGRCGDFDRLYMPVCSCLGERWKRVDRAFREGQHLPPVKLYKLDGTYFVEDGNHRVSVAHHRGLPTIEAEVTELLVAGTSPGDPADEHEGEGYGGWKGVG